MACFQAIDSFNAIEFVFLIWQHWKVGSLGCPIIGLISDIFFRGVLTIFLMSFFDSAISHR